MQKLPIPLAFTVVAAFGGLFGSNAPATECLYKSLTYELHQNLSGQRYISAEHNWAADTRSIQQWFRVQTWKLSKYSLLAKPMWQMRRKELVS